MSQLVHNDVPPVAIEGMAADTQQNSDTVSAFVKSGEGPISFGRFVTAEGTEENPYSLKLPATAGEVSATGLGIAVVDVSIERAKGNVGTGYQDQESVPVMKKGRVWMVAEDQITAINQAAFVRFQNGVLGVVAGANTADHEPIAAKWVTTTAGAAELAILELDL